VGADLELNYRLPDNANLEITPISERVAFGPAVQRLTRFTATLDHVRPVAEDGDNSLENLVAACLDGLASR
jgi:HNH endonuclease